MAESKVTYLSPCPVSLPPRTACCRRCGPCSSSRCCARGAAACVCASPTAARTSCAPASTTRTFPGTRGAARRLQTTCPPRTNGALFPGARGSSPPPTRGRKGSLTASQTTGSSVRLSCGARSSRTAVGATGGASSRCRWTCRPTL